VLQPVVTIRLDEIYVPVKRRKSLEPDKVEVLAGDILEHGQKTPIHVRRDKARFVLVTGLHRVEALRALGENTVAAMIVGARQY
jgi:sulfiredoxin